MHDITKLQNFAVDFDARINGESIRGTKIVRAAGTVSAIHIVTAHFFTQGAPCRILRCRCFAAIQGRKPDLVFLPSASYPRKVDAGKLDARPV
jgi:hypothetical protein